MAALWWLDRSAGAGPRRAATAARWPTRGDEPGHEPSRRGVLIAMGALAATAAVMGGAGRCIGKVRARIERHRASRGRRLGRRRFPTGLETQVAGITPFRIANKDFYRVDTRLDRPIVDIDDWTLTIDGDVDKELTFTFDELLAMPLIERDITLTCVSNSVGGKYVGGARWLGVRLTDLLDLAGVGAKADQILSTDFDGMTISTPLDAGHRRPRRDDRARHERRAAAPRARLPGPDGDPRPLRVHQRDQVGHQADPDDVRRRRRRTGPSATGPPTPRSSRRPGSTPPSRWPRSPPARRSSAGSPGPRTTAASPRSR